MTACSNCLSRPWLLAKLAGWIERVAMNSPGKRARELLALGDVELAAAVGHPRPNALTDTARKTGAESIATELADADVWATCVHAPDWPGMLDALGAAMPRALFGRGERGRLAALCERPTVALVGARRASDYGRGVAADLARELADAGVTIVSGLAYGVDAAAHRGALDGGAATIAVLGSGADVPYPPGERGIYDRIVSDAVVLSEMPPGFEPRRWCFPARNRVIAALSAMTVVVQARKRSGSLITADMAAELGRDIGAVPGPVTSSLSAGANGLLADGAAVVRGARDVLDHMLGIGMAIDPAVLGPQPVTDLEPALASILAAVEEGGATPDQVSLGTGIAAAETAAGLTRLELLGLVRVDALGRYARVIRGGL
jgi:DNA processing protein